MRTFDRLSHNNNLRFNLTKIYRLTDSFSTLHIATGAPKCYVQIMFDFFQASFNSIFKFDMNRLFIFRNCNFIICLHFTLPKTLSLQVENIIWNQIFFTLLAAIINTSACQERNQEMNKFMYDTPIWNVESEEAILKFFCVTKVFLIPVCLFIILKWPVLLFSDQMEPLIGARKS